MFNAISFAWPSPLQDVVTAVNGAMGSAGAELAAAQSRLAGAPDYEIDNNPVAANATGSITEFGQIIDAMLAPLRVVCVHPWVQGVGEGENHYRYLSTANAVAAAASKFVDANDHDTPSGNVDALVLLLSANGFFGFAETLKQFNAVFPLPFTQLCERRAMQIASVETEKAKLPDAAVNAFWRGQACSHIPPVNVAASAVGELSAHAEAYELGGSSPTQELDALIAKKAAAITATQNSVASIKASFSGGSGKVKFFSNKTPAQIKLELASSGIGHDSPLCCCVVFSGAVGSLELLREFVGL